MVSRLDSQQITLSCVRLQKNPKICLSKKALVANCFRDRCNKVEKFDVTCGTCARTGTGEQLMDCKDDGDQICVVVSVCNHSSGEG